MNELGSMQTFKGWQRAKRKLITTVFYIEPGVSKSIQKIRKRVEQLRKQQEGSSSLSKLGMK